MNAEIAFARAPFTPDWPGLRRTLLREGTPDRVYFLELLIDEEIKRIFDTAYDGASKLLNQHWEKVVAVAEALLKHETLLSDDVDKLMKGGRLSKPTVADLLAAEADKTPPRQVKPPTEDPGEDMGGVMPSPA